MRVTRKRARWSDRAWWRRRTGPWSLPPPVRAEHHRSMTNLADTFADLQTVTARDLMGVDHETIHAGACVAEVEERLMTGRARHLIVIDDEGRCAGVVSARHLAEARRFHPGLDPHQAPIEDL